MLSSNETPDEKTRLIYTIIFNISTYVFYIASGIPCFKLIWKKNQSVQNISIIPIFSCYIMGVLYFGYHFVITENKTESLTRANIILAFFK